MSAPKFLDWDSEIMTASVFALTFAHARHLPHFLALAAHEESIEAVLQNPELARYVSDWGRHGDVGVAAFTPVDNDSDELQIIGMAWARLWKNWDRGFGFVDELTPEMCIAVSEGFRGQGVGTALFGALKCRLRALKLNARWDWRQQKMVPHVPIEAEQSDEEISPAHVSLNIPADSPAAKFCVRCGFQKIEGRETSNHTGGASHVWRASLHEGGHWKSGSLDRSINVNGAGAPEKFVNVDLIYKLKFSLFDENDWARFDELMRSLPGRDRAISEWDETDEINNWAYFGPIPLKSAVVWSHLYVSMNKELEVRGDIEWDEWCEWEEAFSWAARSLPHSLTQEESPELKALCAMLKTLGQENREMRSRLRQLEDI